MTSLMVATKPVGKVLADRGRYVGQEGEHGVGEKRRHELGKARLGGTSSHSNFDSRMTSAPALAMPELAPSA